MYNELKILLNKTGFKCNLTRELTNHSRFKSSTEYCLKSNIGVHYIQFLIDFENNEHIYANFEGDWFNGIMSEQTAILKIHKCKNIQLIRRKNKIEKILK